MLFVAYAAYPAPPAGSGSGWSVFTGSDAQMALNCVGSADVTVYLTSIGDDMSECWYTDIDNPNICAAGFSFNASNLTDPCGANTNQGCTNNGFAQNCTPANCTAGQYFQSTSLGSSCFPISGGCPTTNCAINPCSGGALGAVVGGINSCYYANSVAAPPPHAIPVSPAQQNTPLPAAPPPLPDPPSTIPDPVTGEPIPIDNDSFQQSSSDGGQITRNVYDQNGNITGSETVRVTHYDVVDTTTNTSTRTTITTTTNNQTGESTSTETISSGPNVGGNGGGGTGDGTGEPSDNSGSAAGTCATAPTCAGDPIQCAQLLQQYYIMCYSDDELAGGSLTNCDTEISCEGDPIQCERARLERENYCSLAQYQGETVEGFYESEGLASVDDIQQGGVWDSSNTEDVGGQIENLLDGVAQADTGTTAACPAPHSISLGFLGSFEIPYTAICDFASMLRPLLLLFATFLSSRNVFNALRGV